MAQGNALLMRRIKYYTEGSNPFPSKLEFNLFGAVVQLVRAPPCHGGRCGFESRQLRFSFIFNYY